MTSVGCHGPTALWPAHQTAVRQKKPATPAGMTDSKKRELEGEDLEVALSGKDYAEEAAVGGEGVFADGEAVEEHAGFGFEDGDFGMGWVGA